MLRLAAPHVPVSFPPCADSVFVCQRSIYFSVMCPRRLGGIQKLFEQAGGDVALNHAKNFTRDPHHLILLNGFR